MDQKTSENKSLTYGSYLKIPELLSLQNPLCDPEQHDELLFISIHQVYELWFKQILHELNETINALGRDQVLKAHKIMKRVILIQDVLLTQLKVLETMTPFEFNAFRQRLESASGFQSIQFRELEIMSGLKERPYDQFFRKDPAAKKKLEKRLNNQSLYEAFLCLLIRKGFEVNNTPPKEGSPEQEKLLQALKTVYEKNENHYELYLLAEFLIEYDESFELWRYHHVKMVERTIGSRIGTGGSSGAGYLRSTLNQNFFPELWIVRARLGDNNF
jgi:tryptophan 2,3-dioxygenase